MTVPNFDYTVFGDNCGHEWKLWLRSFELFTKASKITDDEEKQTMLLHFAGQKVQEIFDSLPDTTANEHCGPLAAGYVLQPSMYENAIAKLNAFFLPKKTQHMNVMFCDK